MCAWPRGDVARGSDGRASARPAWHAPVMSDADDLVKNAGRLFQKLGVQLRESASVAGEQLLQTTRQVTGLGRGTVQIEIDTPRVAPGGTVQGRVVLALPEA